MDSNKSASTGNEHANSSASDKRGKYRIMAEIKRLEQDSKFLEEELEEVERLEDASSICKELLLYVETKPDALLPVTNGPANPLWNRWFEGFQDSEGCRCRIM
ncbi:G protein gamma domain-containing protein [Psidium guajava]|nr:G protein gamma domain-containing protein [Psidium guajava]